MDSLVLEFCQVVVEEDQPPDLLYNTFEIPSLATNTKQGVSNLAMGLAKARATFNSTSKLKVLLT